MALMDRVIGAAQLKVDTYEDVERDTDATSQALTVVVVVALAQGIGALIASVMQNDVGAGVFTLVAGVLSALLGWFVGSYIIYFVGTSLFGGTATWGEVLRTLGFAYAPSILGAFIFIPVLGELLRFVGGIWTLIAFIIAIRQSLDFTTGKAIATAIIGGIAYFIIFVIIGMILAFFGLTAAWSVGAIS